MFVTVHGVLIAILLGGLPSLASAAPCTLDKLGWIAGTWRDAKDPSKVEERWVLAPEGTLMGNAWGFPGKGAGFAEAMTITEVAGAVSMRLRHFDGKLDRAWEEREAPMIFIASDCEAHTAVFSGAGPHEGEKLTYRRAGSKLTITGDFLHRGVPDHEVFQFVRAHG